MSPENAILLAFAQPIVEKAQLLSAIDDYIEKCDQDLLLKLAKLHKLNSIIYESIRNHALESYFSEKFVQSLGELYKSVFFKNIKLFEVFKKVVDTLQKESIECMALKGIALASDIYPNPCLRPMIDIDILIREYQHPRALQILQCIGRVSQYENKTGLSDYAKDKSIVISGVSVEVHKMFTAEYQHVFFPSEILWQNSHIVERNASKYSVLNHEANINALATHLFVHAEAESPKFIWFLDIALYINKYRQQIDNDYLWELSRTMGSTQALIYSFLFVEKYLNVHIEWPENIDKTTNLSLEKVFFDTFPETTIKTKAYYTDKVKMIPGMGNRLKYVVSRFFPSVGYMKIKYRKKTKLGAVLYYPVFLKDAVAVLFKSMRK